MRTASPRSTAAPLPGTMISGGRPVHAPMTSARMTPPPPPTPGGASSASYTQPRPRSARPTWSPPRSHAEKDALIEKLVHDNEALMKEVAELDAQLRQGTEQRHLIESENAALLKDQRERENAEQISERMLRSMEEQVGFARSEREEQARQHAADKEYLTGVLAEGAEAANIIAGRTLTNAKRAMGFTLPGDLPKGL